MLKWHIDYFGLKLLKKKLVQKKKKKTLSPHSVLLESRKHHLPMGDGGLPYHQGEGIQEQESCKNAYCQFLINLIN